jgi:hypothetical protein
MAFTGDFEVLQGYDVSAISLSDVSAGADATITGRQVRLFFADGTPLLPQGNTLGYIDWPPDAGDTLVIPAILDRSYALKVQVDWIVPVLTDGNDYQAIKVYCLKGYGEQFDYSLTQKMAANPRIIQDTLFLKNKGQLRVYLDNAQNAVALASDQSNAQFNLDLAYTLQQSF